MKRMLFALFVALMLAAGAVAQVETTPPLPAAPRATHVPAAAEQVLANGLRVIVIPKHNVPLVSARMIIKTGGASDPDNRAGLADMTASLLIKGTTTRSAQQIAEGVESLGATIDGSAGWDGSFVTTSAMSSKLPQALAYVADVVRHPTFTAKELNRLRTQNLDSLQVGMHEPRTLRSMVTRASSSTTRRTDTTSEERRSRSSGSPGRTWWPSIAGTIAPRMRFSCLAETSSRRRRSLWQRNSSAPGRVVERRP